MTAVTLTRARGVIHARLDQPELRNAVTPALLDTLHAAVDSAEADPHCRVLVLRARGEDFCAGTDLSDGAPAEVPAPDADELPYWTLLERRRARRRLRPGDRRAARPFPADRGPRRPGARHGAAVRGPQDR
jgi:polyketide biosynthesis enoyl-CoA hydratase PksH